MTVNLKEKYHWLVLAACCGLAISSIGICCNSLGVFYTPVSEALGVGRGDFALHATISQLAAGLCCPLAVALLRRCSLKLVLAAGIVLASLSTGLMALADHIAWFYVLGALRGVGCALYGLTPLMVVLGNWFQKKHGMAVGIAMCCSGLGGAVFTPIFQQLLLTVGWRTAFLVMAAFIAVLALPGALSVLCLKPSRKGLLPYGAVAASVQEEAVESGLSEKKSAGKSGFLSPAFPISILFALLCACITGLGQHFPGYAEHAGIGAAVGALMVSASMVGNIVSKLILGVLSDAIGPFRSCSLMTLINCGALLALSLLPVRGSLLPLVCAFFYGTIYSVAAVGVPLVVRFVFGPERYDAVYGVVAVFTSCGGALGLSVIGYLYDFFGGYGIAIGGCAVLGAVNVALLLVLALLRKREQAAGPEERSGKISVQAAEELS